MPRTPTRLHGPAQVSNAAATKFTVPAGQKYIVRHIHVQNPSGAAVTLTVSIGADAAATRILDAYSIPAAAAGVTDSVRDIFCYYVLEAAEILQAFAGTNNILTLTINGDVVTLG
ncbi:MAG TPA: hypothetical protein VJ890_24760 [Vineibacter sp.]|nr:hypothetical protein [Vineibacter sp.]